MTRYDNSIRLAKKFRDRPKACRDTEGVDNDSIIQGDVEVRTYQYGTSRELNRIDRW
jgi:hypothetical protein